MTKIKVVQIAMAGAGDGAGSTEWDFHYLDDKGRVWYDGGHIEKYDKKSDNSYKTRWITEWKQIDLPNDPESEG